MHQCGAAFQVTGEGQCDYCGTAFGNEGGRYAHFSAVRGICP